MQGQSLGQKVRALRGARGWSGQELAIRAGLSKATISRLETGKRKRPSLDSAKGIAYAFGIDVDDLLNSRSTAELVRLMTALRRGNTEIAR